jgi:enoyl-CoA hydratase/carnithine racemase
MSDSVLYEVKDGVATITLNESESRNTWTMAIMTGLFGAVSRLGSDPDARVGILTSNGPAFCAGANLKDARVHATTNVSQYEEGKDNSIYDAMMNCPKPIIAAVNGPAVGAGATLAVGCDIRIASTNASFVWPMASFGIIPANGTLVRLARVVGAGNALELTLSAKKIDAKEAARIMLVNRVVAPDRLMDEALELASAMAEQAPLSLQFIKEALYRGLDMGLHDAIHADRYRQFILYNTEDRKDASRAWLEKREPRFKGE